MQTTQIFDGHNDTLLSLRQTGRPFFDFSARGHVDLPRAKSGGLVGGLFAIWVPDPGHNPLDSDGEEPDVSAYVDVDAMPFQMDLSTAQLYALESLAAIAKLERECKGAVAIVRTVNDIRQNAEPGGVVSIEIHFEGAEPIDPGLNTLEAFYLAGVRSIGPVWSRLNVFAHGVPFQFPGSPDTGPGLTDAGKALVSACNQLGILIDLSHLNEAGFWDVVRQTSSEDAVHIPIVSMTDARPVGDQGNSRSWASDVPRGPARTDDALVAAMATALATIAEDDAGALVARCGFALRDHHV